MGLNRMRPVYLKTSLRIRAVCSCGHLNASEHKRKSATQRLWLRLRDRSTDAIPHHVHRLNHTTNTPQLHHHHNYSITTITTTTITYPTPTRPKLEPPQTQLPPPLLISPQQLPHSHNHHRISTATTTTSTAIAKNHLHHYHYHYHHPPNHQHNHHPPVLIQTTSSINFTTIAKTTTTAPRPSPP
ncbi:hypothetical protein DPMN_002146 [Dreissena polymorpha]|uniref:Uncharacterized protein n=1 Tax=Dreissena polymorpha TaxID=45954 RepID=A0A9D4MKQ2_DREPO|nr:hypothetical protein DPMN_002146 [Dreissena polymorpha]